MIIRLSQLIFCFALFYSSQSAAYNEAMCILIKQEMQQYSNNKASQKFRKAARDYKNNCNKPKQIQVKPEPVVKEPEPIIIEPVPDVESLTEVVEKAPVQAASLPDIKKTKVSELPPVHDATLPDMTDINEDQSANKVTVNDSAEQDKQSVILPPHEAVNIPSQPPLVMEPTSREQSASSLLIPSLFITIVLLIALMVLVRIRRTKHKNTESLTSSSASRSNLPTSLDTQKIPKNDETPFEEKDAGHFSSLDDVKEPSTHRVDKPTEQCQALQGEVAQRETDLKDKAFNENITDTLESDPDSDLLNSTVDATYNKIKEDAEPNTEEFEAAAKSTFERIKTASDFSEPEVREFDPEAKPIKIKRNPPPPLVTEDKPTEVEQPLVEQTNTQEPTIADNPIIDESAVFSSASGETNLFTSEHHFKEPEVREFDPNAPLPGRKSSPTKSVAKVSLQQSSTENETHDERKQADDNPFANLSLDESWDPNSPNKPTIEQKKRPPKSQALIDAEQRAKKMQTKE